MRKENQTQTERSGTGSFEHTSTDQDFYNNKIRKWDPVHSYQAISHIIIYCDHSCDHLAASS